MTRKTKDQTTSTPPADGGDGDGGGAATRRKRRSAAAAPASQNDLDPDERAKTLHPLWAAVGFHPTSTPEILVEDDGFDDADEYVALDKPGPGTPAALREDRAPGGPGHWLMDRADLDQAIAVAGYRDGFDALSREEEQRVRLLLDHRDRIDRWRPHLVANAIILERLRVLDAASPNFTVVTKLVTRAAHLSLQSGQPLRLPPVLMLGSPGIGKTRYARALAAALGTGAEVIAGTTLADVKALTGYGTAWKGAGQGRLTKALIAADTSAPLIFIDEADKVRDHDAHASPLDILLTLLEAHSAARFVDEYLQVPIRADRVLWFMSANTIDEYVFSAPLLSRLVVITVPDLTPDQQDGVVRVMLAEIAAAANLFVAPPGPEVFEALRAIGLRRARLALELALAYAVEAGRRHLTRLDVGQAIALLAGGDPGANRRPIGFGIRPSGPSPAR